MTDSRPTPALLRAALPLCLLAVSLAACAGRGGRASGLGGAAPDSAAMLRDITYLASDALEGRATGAPGNDSAAAYIARRLTALGLDAQLQRFTARPAAGAHGGSGIDSVLPSQNVYAVIRGSDAALRGQYVVLGAHYDHLGRWTFGAIDANAGAVIRNGADDNASGTAAVLELARLLARRPPRRSVVVALFSGEELGLLGSQYMVEHFPVPLDSVAAMLNFDMVGRMRDGKLIVYGTATAAEFPAVVEAANRAAAGAGEPLTITATGDGFGASDHSSFYAKNLPVLHFFTNVHDDYHRATDDVERIAAGGAARVVALAERIVRDVADRPARLTFIRAPSSAMGGARSSGTGGTYFGSVPDMGAGDVKGMRISGVSPGSPADKAGLKAGDVVVSFGGVVVTDLYSYTDALRAKKPGDVVEVVVVRGGERLTLTATLGRRGGG
jgi:hypothetical protein